VNFDTGYVLSYKRDHGNWQEVQLDADRTSYTLQSLHCGATYHAYLTAYNRVGNSRTSAIVTAITKGGGKLQGFVAEHFECVVCWLCSHQLLAVYSHTL
jgi:hypothetical protein